MVKVGVFGAGLAGLSASYHLGTVDNVVLEADNCIGGVAASVMIDGFTFDYGPHIIYSKSEYVKELYKDLLGKNIIFNGVRRNFICTLGKRIPFPFEANLRHAPAYVGEECILGALHRKVGKSSNFKEWILNIFGEGIAKYYMIPYNEKIWKYDLAKMSLEWIADRVVMPSVEDIVMGALRKQRKIFGPNAFFWFPRTGGTGAIPEALAKRVKHIELGAKVIRIKGTRDGLHVSTKSRDYSFDKVLSSIPLPELVRMIDDVPSRVMRAAENLAYNSLCCVFIGLRSDTLPRWTAAYVPDRSINFHRLSFPKMFSPKTVPEGKSSINIEITFKKGSRIMEEDEAGKAVDGLKEIGILKKAERPLFAKTRVRKYAYPIYDLDHRRNTKIIHGFLRSKGIIPIGRFGEWEYFNTDHAVLSGKKGAETVRDLLN